MKNPLGMVVHPVPYGEKLDPGRSPLLPNLTSNRLPPVTPPALVGVGPDRSGRPRPQSDHRAVHPGCAGKASSPRRAGRCAGGRPPPPACAACASALASVPTRPTGDTGPEAGPGQPDARPSLPSGAWRRTDRGLFPCRRRRSGSRGHNRRSTPGRSRGPGCRTRGTRHGRNLPQQWYHRHQYGQRHHEEPL